MMAVIVVDNASWVIDRNSNSTWYALVIFFDVQKLWTKTNDTRHRDITSRVHRYVYTSTDEIVAVSVDVILMARLCDTRVARVSRVFIADGGGSPSDSEQ